MLICFNALSAQKEKYPSFFARYTRKQAAVAEGKEDEEEDEEKKMRKKQEINE